MRGEKAGIIPFLDNFAMLKRLLPPNTCLKTEITAGLTTFLTMSYILAVNPHILGSTGMDKGAIFVATCLAAALGSFLMGFLANYPIALAPSMSLNVYFAYIVVAHLGYPWETALGAVFVSGVLFALMTWTGIRQWLVHFLPEQLKIGIMCGIGLFLGLIGLKNLNLISLSPGPHFHPEALLQWQVLLAALGFLLILLFEKWKLIGAIFLSILIITFIAIPTHLTEFQGITDIPPSLSPVFFKLHLPNLLDIKLVFATLVFLFVALFDNTGTLIAVLTQAKLVSKEGKIEHLKPALLADSIANVAGALLGTSSTGSYIESATGVRAGGRTGLTAIVVGGFFLVALFFAPLIETIPAFATAPALIYVSSLMAGHLKTLFQDHWIKQLPGIITAITIPFTFSIAVGVSLGIVLYVIKELLCGQAKRMHFGMWILFSLSLLYLLLH